MRELKFMCEIFKCIAFVKLPWSCGSVWGPIGGHNRSRFHCRFHCHLHRLNAHSHCLQKYAPYQISNFIQLKGSLGMEKWTVPFSVNLYAVIFNENF